MKYQLVLQWAASTIADYDAMITVEGLLIEGLTSAKVDGHDMGSDEVNIFIQTNDPQQTFGEIGTILRSNNLWSDARVAFRGVADTKYKVLWPTDLTNFRVA